MTYTYAELEDSLRCAFVDRHADYIVIDSRRQEFLISSANYGVSREWLKGQIVEHDRQSSSWMLTLTDKGKEHFGLV